MVDREYLSRFSKDELFDLLDDAAKNWLAHDGLWFLDVEKQFGTDAAMHMDVQIWEQFSAIEAIRIMRRLGLGPGGGVPALAEALRLRLYAHLNVQDVEVIDDYLLVSRIKHCRVQTARQRKGMPIFECRPVGQAGHEGFARAIDPRFAVRCLSCPPDSDPEESWCAWEFRLTEGKDIPMGGR